MPDNLEFSPVLERQAIYKKVIAKLWRQREAQLTDGSLDQPISVLVRSYNEAKNLERFLKMIKNQVYEAPVQIIVQDNGSTDNSLELAKKYGATIVRLPQEQFNYPKSLNLGLDTAKHEIVAISVAHALPAHNYWLRSLANHFADEKVAGVYGWQLDDIGTKVNERFWRLVVMLARLTKSKNIKRVRPGTFGATNCAMRRSLWQRHKFNESYAVGAEDTEWATWAIKQGYKMIYDPLFLVHHSHKLNFWQNAAEMRRYFKMVRVPLSMEHLSPHAKRRFGKD